MSNRIKYAKPFYSKLVLAAAINAYRKIANISLSEDDNYYYCEFFNCIVPADRIIHEFDNYLIELLNSQEVSTE